MPVSNPSEKSSNGRRKVVALSLAILLPGALFGGSQMLQNRAQQSSGSRHEMIARFNESLNLSPELKAQQRERAAMLRNKWRPWALENRAELRRMLHASKNDKSALLAVWDKVPNSPGLHSAATDYVMALHYPEKDTKLRNGQSFTWNAMSKPGTHYANSASATRVEGERRASASLQWDLEHNFASHRDIVISRSIQSGTSGICLWASGRVTEITSSKVTTDKNGMPVQLAKHRELQPPYEFLNNEETI